VNGRPLQITICNDADTESTSANCARQAVANHDVATVGDNTEYGTADDPILLNANIAAVGANPLAAADFSSPNVFPVNPGGAATIAGEAVALVDAGSTKIAVARVDNPAAAEVDTFANIALGAKNLKVAKDVPVPATAPDFSQYVADATSGGTNGLLIAMNQNQAEQFINSLRQAGVKMPIAIDSTAIPPAALKKLGSAANGMLVSNEFKPLSSNVPGITQFKNGMKKYAPQAPLNDFSLNGWLAVQQFAGSMKQQHVTDITNTSVLAAMKQVRNLNLGGVIPNWSSIPSTLPSLSQGFNLAVTLAKVKAGNIVATSNSFTYPIPGTAPSLTSSSSTSSSAP
jgi:ABC-type branched-subunit amino acid transport system substrate-binding protein